MNFYYKLFVILIALLSVNSAIGQKVRKGTPQLLKSEIRETNKDSIKLSTKHRIGLWGGYDFLQHSVDNQLFRFLPGFKSCCPGFNQVTSGNGWAFGLLHEMAFFNALSFEDNLQFRVSYRTLNAQLQEDEYLGKIRNTNNNTLIDVNSRHTLDATAAFITFEPRYSIKPTRLPLFIGVGLEGGLAMGDFSAILDEKLINTVTSVTYIDQNGNSIGNSFRRVDSTIGSDRRNSLFVNGLTLSFSVPISLSERLKVKPEFSYYIQLPLSQSSLLKPLSEIGNDRLWTVQTMRAGISLQYEFGSKPPPLILIEDYIRRDTTEYISSRVMKDSVVLVNESIEKEEFDEKIVNTLVQKYSAYKYEKPKPAEDTSPIKDVVVKPSTTEDKPPISEDKPSKTDVAIIPTIPTQKPILPKEWKTVKDEKTLRDSITCALIKDTTIQKTRTVTDSSTYTKTILTTYQKVTSSLKTKPTKIDTMNGKIYYTYLKTDTTTKERGIQRDSLYLDDEDRDEEPCAENEEIIIVTIEREYIKLIPCKVEPCGKYETWNWRECECDESIGNNEIRVALHDSKGTPVGDTIYYTTKKKQKTTFIFPYVFFNFGASEINKDYDKIVDDLKHIESDITEYKYHNPIHLFGKKIADKSVADTVVLWGNYSKEEKKNIIDEREKYFVNFLTKPIPDNGYGLDKAIVLSSREFEQNEKKKRKKTEINRYTFTTKIPEYSDLNNRFNQNVYVVSPKSLMPVVENTQENDVVSPDTLVIQPKAGLNNYFKGNIILKNNFVNKDKEVDTSKGYRLPLRQGPANVTIKEKIRKGDKSITLGVTYANGLRSEGKTSSLPQRFFYISKISPQEQKKRSIADSAVYENEVFIPFYIFGDIDYNNTPRNPYEKNVVEQLRGQMTAQSKVVFEVSPLMPDDRIVELKKLFPSQANIIVKKRAHNNKSPQNTWQALVKDKPIVELVKESRVTVIIITPI